MRLVRQFFGASPRRTRRRSHRGRRARLRTRTRSSARPAGRVRAMPRFIKNFVCLSEGSRSTYSNGRAGGVGKRLVDVPTGATRFARHVAACRTGFDPTAPAPLREAVVRRSNAHELPVVIPGRAAEPRFGARRRAARARGSGARVVPSRGRTDERSGFACRSACSGRLLFPVGFSPLRGVVS